MRLLKWLFQPAYILLIIVLLALYVNRELLFPKEVDDSIEAEALVAKVDNLAERLRSQNQAAASGTTEKQGMPRQEPSLMAKTQEESAVEEERQAANVAEEGDATAIDEGSTVLSSAAVGKPVMPSQSNEVQSVMGGESRLLDKPAPAQVQSNEPGEEVSNGGLKSGEERESIAAIVPQAPAEPMLPPVRRGSPQNEAPSPLATWRAARAAVWQGNLERAVEHYQALIAMQPDNFDAYGEMGNVLLAQSKVQAAIEAYTSASRLIARAGYREMAWRVADIVAQLDDKQGRALYEELSR